jgi:hypothetical protein
MSFLPRNAMLVGDDRPVTTVSTVRAGSTTVGPAARTVV